MVTKSVWLESDLNLNGFWERRGNCDLLQGPKWYLRWIKPILGTTDVISTCKDSQVLFTFRYDYFSVLLVVVLECSTRFDALKDRRI